MSSIPSLKGARPRKIRLLLFPPLEGRPVGLLCLFSYPAQALFLANLVSTLHIPSRFQSALNVSRSLIRGQGFGVSLSSAIPVPRPSGYMPGDAYVSHGSTVQSAWRVYVGAFQSHIFLEHLSSTLAIARRPLEFRTKPHLPVHPPTFRATRRLSPASLATHQHPSPSLIIPVCSSAALTFPTPPHP